MSNRWFEDREWVLLEMRGEDRVDFLTRLTTNILPSSESRCEVIRCGHGARTSGSHESEGIGAPVNCA